MKTKIGPLKIHVYLGRQHVLFFFLILFIFGCTGSSLLRVGFL